MRPFNTVVACLFFVPHQHHTTPHHSDISPLATTQLSRCCFPSHRTPLHETDNVDSRVTPMQVRNVEMSSACVPAAHSAPLNWIGICNVSTGSFLVVEEGIETNKHRRSCHPKALVHWLMLGARLFHAIASSWREAVWGLIGVLECSRL